jgi:hypothetical protein
MVLIFVVQSTGLISVIYLAFCLARINYSISLNAVSRPKPKSSSGP